MLNSKLFLLAVFFSGCIVIPTYKAHISLIPISQNAQDIRIDHILLVGTGTVASRVFLDNLSTEMKQSFTSRGIKSEFSYIGKMPLSAPIQLDSLKQDKYDTYLVFKAANKSHLDMTKEKFIAFGPGATATGYGNQYVETYTVTLYNGKGDLQILWEGELAVDFDLANDGRYKQIAKLIFSQLIKDRILLGQVN